MFGFNAQPQLSVAENKPVVVVETYDNGWKMTTYRSVEAEVDPELGERAISKRGRRVDQRIDVYGFADRGRFIEDFTSATTPPTQL